ncbi:platelet glycoprotein Ib alpha chain [Discoglossus pictus]
MNYLHYQTFFIILLSTKATANFNCSRIQGKDIVETSFINEGLTGVPLSKIPKHTNTLCLQFNKLKIISTSTFQGLPQMLELDLSSNALSSINIDSYIPLTYLNMANNSLVSLPKFTKLKNLTYLILSYNHITTVPDTTFFGLSQLKDLNLTNNRISDLSDQVFENLQALESLDLSFNELRSVPRRLLSDAVLLEKFSLSGNRLTELPDQFFDDVENLAYVFLDQNPWQCNCALDNFKEWLDENTHVVYKIENEIPVIDVESVLCSNLPDTPLVSFSMDKCGRSIGMDEDDVTLDMKHNMEIQDISTQEMPSTSNLRQTTATEPATTEVAVETTSVHETTTMTRELITSTTPTLKLTIPMTTHGKLLWTTSKETKYVPSTKAPIETTTLPTITTMKTELITSVTPTLNIVATTYGRVITEKEEDTTSAVISTRKIVVPTTESATTITLKEEPKTTLQVHTSPIMWTTKNRDVIEQPVYTMTAIPDLPVTYVPVAPVGMERRRSWLEDTIIRHCCFLHLLLYLLILLFLLVLIVASTAFLVWAYVHYYRLYHIISQKPDMVRLIRYSLRVKREEQEMLLKRIGNGDSDFTSQLLSGAIPMVILETEARSQEKKFTSAIL